MLIATMTPTLKLHWYSDISSRLENSIGETGYCMLQG